MRWRTNKLLRRRKEADSGKYNSWESCSGPSHVPGRVKVSLGEVQGQY